MAKGKKEKDVLSRLADRGEEALSKLADLPGGTKALKTINDLRERVDELGKKVRGIDGLDARDRGAREGAGGIETPGEAGCGAVPGPQAAARKPARRRPRSDRARHVSPWAERENRLDSAGRHAQPEPAGQRLEPRRRRSRLLAVELDRHRRRPTRW